MKKLTAYLLLIIFVVSCKSIDPAKRYQKSTREYSYEFRSSQTAPGFLKRLFSKDPRIDQAKKIVKTHNRLKKEDEINKKVESQVEDILSKIK